MHGYQNLPAETKLPKIKLAEIKDCIAESKQTWWDALTFGYYQQERQIKALLAELANQPKAYILNQADLFKLINIVKNENYIIWLNPIRSLFVNSWRLFAVIRALDKTTAPNEKNYLAILALGSKALEFLHEFFCQETPHAMLTQDMLEAVIELGQADSDSFYSFGVCVDLLIKNDIFNKETLQLAVQGNKEKNHYAFYTLLKALDQLKALNQEAVSIISKHLSRYTYDLEKLLPCMAESTILNNESLEMVCQAKIESYLVDIVKLLNQSRCLEKDMLTQLLQQDFGFGYTIKSFCQLLFDSKLLNKDNFILALKMHDNWWFNKAVQLLSENKFLNQTLLNHVAAMSDDRCHYLVRFFEYLKLANLLSEDNIKRVPVADDLHHSLYPLVLLCESFQAEKFKINQENLTLLLSTKEMEYRKSYLCTLAEALSKCDLFSNAVLNKLLLLSKVNLSRITDAVNALSQHHLLDQRSFDHAFALVIAKLPPPAESKVTKIKRHQPELPRSQYQLDSGQTFYVEHNPEKKYDKGGMAVVKKAYATATSQVPIYALKRLTKHGKEEAIREVKHLRLLGRKAFFFANNNKAYVLSPWWSGKSGDAYTPAEIQREEGAKRLQWLILALLQIKILHKNNRVHGDIKPSNFILDIITGDIHLIDFGSSRKLGSNKTFAETRGFLSGSGYLYRFAEDVYSMGLTAAAIFPELYSSNIINDKTVIERIKTDPLTVFDQALVTLISAMTAKDWFNRCSIDDALRFCQQLALNITRLDEGLLKKITAETINHSPLSVEDVMYRRFRQ